jgi:biotin transport system permease protein
MSNGPIGIYRPGRSPVHRTRTGVKLLLLLLLTSLLLAWRSVPTVLLGVALTAGLYALAGFSPRVLLEQARPLRWLVLLLVPFQLLLSGWQGAVTIVGTMVIAVLLAGLVSLTTTTTQILDAIEGVLRPLPDDVSRRIALLLALTIRAVPVIADLADDVRQARRARGMERSPRAYVTPVVLRTIGYSQRLGEALVARGVDDK